MLQKLQISKTTTFSESSGRQLSHCTPLYRSYIFRILSNLRFSFSSFCVFLAFSAQSHCKNMNVGTLPFLHDFTLFVIDMHQNRSVSPFWTPIDQFHFHALAALIWWVQLRSCHICWLYKARQNHLRPCLSIVTVQMQKWVDFEGLRQVAKVECRD